MCQPFVGFKINEQLFQAILSMANRAIQVMNPLFLLLSKPTIG
jgi:hypothetical protein